MREQDSKVSGLRKGVSGRGAAPHKRAWARTTQPFKRVKVEHFVGSRKCELHGCHRE